MYHDKTGRGDHGELIQKNLLQMENKQSYTGDKLHLFAKYAEPGEVWENRESRFERI